MNIDTTNATVAAAPTIIPGPTAIVHRVRWVR
jgi:hypothetical protein